MTQTERLEEWVARGHVPPFPPWYAPRIPHDAGCTSCGEYEIERRRSFTIGDTKSFTEVLGRAIRCRRELTKIGLAEMARVVGLSPSGYSRLETGSTVVDVNKLKTICDRLEVSPTVLMNDTLRLFV